MAGDSGVIAGLERQARRYATWLWINVGILLIGGFLTLATYNAASSGESYVVFSGAIGGGLLFAIINGVRYLRTTSRITEAAGPPGRTAPPQAASRPAGPDQVFNPPPGWPSMPEGWRPGTDWRPDPSWPARPQGWNLLVDPELLMAPLDLSGDLHLGSPAGVTKGRLNEVSDRAADAIA
jgi:hypothetical protein